MLKKSCVSKKKLKINMKKKLFLTHTGQLYNQICYDRQTHFMSGIVCYYGCFFFPLVKQFIMRNDLIFVVFVACLGILFVSRCGVVGRQADRRSNVNFTKYNFR